MRSEPFGNDADYCRENGITIGTKLKGVSKYGTVEIVVTGLGENNLLARQVSFDGEPIKDFERNWTLSSPNREWNIVSKKAGEA